MFYGNLDYVFVRGFLIMYLFPGVLNYVMWNCTDVLLLGNLNATRFLRASNNVPFMDDVCFCLFI